MTFTVHTYLHSWTDLQVSAGTDPTLTPETEALERSRGSRGAVDQHRTSTTTQNAPPLTTAQAVEDTSLAATITAASRTGWGTFIQIYESYSAVRVEQITKEPNFLTDLMLFPVSVWGSAPAAAFHWALPTDPGREVDTVSSVQEFPRAFSQTSSTSSQYLTTPPWSISFKRRLSQQEE